MIDRIAVRGFKSLRNVTVDLGRWSLFVGANAGGKSNFFDALRVLQGVGNGFAVSEILDGKPRSATGEVWEGVRGGSAKACFYGSEQSETFSVSAGGKLNRGEEAKLWQYFVTLSPSRGRVVEESLRYGGRCIYGFRAAGTDGVEPPIIEVEYRRESSGRPGRLPLDRSRPVLGQFGGSERVSPRHRMAARRVAGVLADMQRIDPALSILRGYSQAQRAVRMGERGEDFAALVKRICENRDAGAGYLQWLRESRPEVDGVATLAGAMNEPLFMLREGQREVPAPVLSDGTLRFAAVAAAFFQPDMPRVVMIDGIEKGIHPSRTRLTVELLRTNAAAGSTQVLATTHSPAVLAWLKPSEYAATFVCRRNRDTGEATITPLRDIAGFREVAETHLIAELFAEGWFEAAL